MLKCINYGKTLNGKTLSNMVLLCIFVFAGCQSNLTPEEGLQRAKTYKDKGNYNAAVIELRNVLRNNPQHGDTRLMLGELYILQRDGHKAETQLQKAKNILQESIDIRSSLGKAFLLQEAYDKVIQEINTDDSDSVIIRADLLSLRAYAHLLSNNREQAKQVFQTALGVNKNNLAALNGLAIINLEKGDYKESSRHVEHAITNDAGNMDTWIIKGRLALGKKQYESAATAFKRAISKQNQDFSFLQPIQATAYLVQVLIEQEKLDEASQVVDKLATTVNAKHPVLHYLHALIAYENDNYDAAREHIQITRSVAADYDPALLLEGAIYYELGSLEQGNSVLTAYLARHPENNTARKLLAATRLKLKQPDQAYELLSPLMNQDPDNKELLLMAGGAMRDAGKPEASISLLEKALQLDPENTDLKIQLASARLANRETSDAIAILKALPPTADKFGKRELLLLLAWSSKKDYDTALAYVDDYIASHPNDPDVLGHSGVILARMGKPDAARKRFEKALDLKPDNSQMLVTLARLEYQEKNYTRAGELLDRVLKIQPDNANVMYTKANISAQNSDKKAAITWLERSRKTSETALEPRLVLVKYYLEQGNIDSAKEITIEATKIAPDRADVWNTYSVVQNKAGDPQGAVDSLRKAEKLKPDSKTILMNLARSQLSTRDITGAGQTLRKLLKLSPDNFQAASMLALTEMKQGNTQQAFDIARKQQASAENRANALSLEGDLHMMSGKYNKAIEGYRAAAKISPGPTLTAKIYSAAKKAALPEPERILQKWLQQHPEDMAISLLLAGEYDRSGNTAMAIQEYESLVKQKPNDPDILNNLALAYHANKDPKAVQTAEKAYSLSTNNAAIKDTLGWILVQEKDVKRGLPLLRDAMLQLPDILEVQYHYAVALAESGDRAGAHSLLQKLATTESKLPAVEAAKEYLQTLKP